MTGEWAVGLRSRRTSALGVARPGGYDPLSQAILAPSCPCLGLVLGLLVCPWPTHRSSQGVGA